MVTLAEIWLTPISAKLSTTVDMNPSTMLTRMITDATPMMMPSMVRKERILLPNMLRMAILNDCSIVFHISVKIDLSVVDPHHPLRLHGDGIVVGDHHDGVSLGVQLF